MLEIVAVKAPNLFDSYPAMLGEPHGPMALGHPGPAPLDCLVADQRGLFLIDPRNCLPSSADSRVGCRVLVARRWHADSLQALFIATQIATVLIPIGQHPALARLFINPVMMQRRPMGMAVDQARIAVFA